MGNKILEIERTRKAERDLLEEKVTILELKKQGMITGKLAESLDFCSEEKNPFMNESYFENERQAFFDLGNELLNEDQLKEKGIPPYAVITKDGNLYRVKNSHEHMNQSLWLLMNGVDLKNSIRLFAWRKEGEFRRVPQFYDGYDLADCKNEKPKNIEHLKQLWDEYHDGETSASHIVQISDMQLKTMQNVCVYFGTSFENVMRTNNSFGLCFRPYEYKNQSDANKSKYNRLTIESGLGIKIDTFRTELR